MAASSSGCGTSSPAPAGGCSTTPARPKPAALALAPTLQPTAVWFVDEGLNGLDVHVAHDPGEPVDLTLTVELLREDGSVLESAEQAWTMEPHGHRRWTVDALLGRFADSSYAYRFGPPPHAAVRATRLDRRRPASHIGEARLAAVAPIGRMVRTGGRMT